MKEGHHKHRVLVLFSGGIDSMGCLKYYERLGATVTALCIDYGQPAAPQERRAARRIADALGLQMRTVRVEGLVIPVEGFISGRNLLLGAIATASAGHSCDIIALGIHSGTSYPDCSASFVQRMQDCVDIYSSGSTIVEAPFVEWGKDEIWTFVREHGLPVDLTYSCERGSCPPCGACASCIDREALNALAT